MKRPAQKTSSPKRHKYDAAVVNESLSIRQLAEKLGAEFKRHGSTWMSCCILPDHPDRTPSLAIWLDTNHFYCFGCQRGGDPLTLIKLFQGWTSRSDFRRVIEYGAQLGGVSPDVDEDFIRQSNERYREKQKLQQKRLEEEKRSKREGAFKRWLNATPISYSDLGYIYLRDRRGVDLRQLPRLPGAVRFTREFAWKLDPTQDHWDKLPAIISLMQKDGKSMACHVTALKEDGSGTDNRVGQKGRLVFGSVRGAAIHLTRGKSGLPPKEAFARYGMDDTLAICEGLEDGLSIALMQPSWRVWPAYSLDNMGNVIAPECVADIVLCAENDVSQGARDALERVKAKQIAAGQGRRVRIAYPPPEFKDWNAVDEYMPEGQ